MKQKEKYATKPKAVKKEVVKKARTKDEYEQMLFEMLKDII